MTNVLQKEDHGFTARLAQRVVKSCARPANETERRAMLRTSSMLVAFRSLSEHDG